MDSTNFGHPFDQGRNCLVSGEAFGYFHGCSGYSGAYEVSVQFAQDYYADGGFYAWYAEDRGGDALGTGLEFAGGYDEGAAGGVGFAAAGQDGFAGGTLVQGVP